MGFRINTNISAMNAHRNSVQTNLGLDKSLQALSSGLRINTAADDASGLSIANSLRAQASGLGQAINNANDGIGVTQTADGALDEYENIINTVRTKSIQAASDGQNADSRKAIQADITKLLAEAQNIATTTSFNGQNLLDGNFTSKNFQIGAYANQTVGISIDSVKIESIGAFAEAEGSAVNTTALVAGNVLINGTDIGASTAGATALGRGAGSAWAKTNAINSVSGATNVTATAETVRAPAAVTGGGAILAGDLTINGVNLNVGVTVLAGDSDNALLNAINDISGSTGVVATNEGTGITLTSDDGGTITIAVANTSNTITGITAGATEGKITLTSTSGSIGIADGTGTASALIGHAAGAIATSENLNTIDVNTYSGAQTAINITDAALKQLDEVRSNIGSTQNQLESTIRNISVTQVNVSAAESQIRDVDFAAESAKFAKFNILAQSGSYAMSQANAVQQNVMRLLQ